jgi:hypothetical protein
MGPRVLLPDTDPNALTTSEWKFISNAICRIRQGEDANVAFAVAAERGERRTRSERGRIKRKKVENGRLPPLQQRLSRLGGLALRLAARDELSVSDREFLAVALSRIGEGEDANLAFGVKAQRGVRRTRSEAAKSDNIRFAMSWITAITTAEENEYFTRPRISLSRAFEIAATKGFRIREETLRTYWYSHPELHSPSFPRPVTSLPD